MSSIIQAETPEFSIIVPAYNQAKFLGAAIESVLLQEYGRFELLIIDDGSTDKTASVAQSYVDQRIRYFYQANAGLSAARNTGIEHATGRHLIFLDSDDFLEPHALLHHRKNFADRPGLDVSIGGWRFVDPQGRTIGQPKVAPSVIDLPQVLMGNPFPVNAAVVARSCLQRVNHFDPALQACEDWDFWLRLLAAGCSMAAFRTPVCVYRMHMGQMTRERKRMHTARLTVLNAAFQGEQAQQQGDTFRARCFASIYAKSAARAYYAGELADGKRDLEHAIVLDPTLVENEGQLLMGLIAGWSSAPYVEDTLGYIAKVYSNLPANALIVQPKRAISRLAIQIAFEAFQQRNWAKVQAAVLKAVRYQPTWLVNRGVLSIFVRSLWQRSGGAPAPRYKLM